MEYYEARSVIGALRRGVPPRMGIETLTVGLTDELAGIKTLLATVTAINGATQCIEGDFGEGKSHLLSLIKERALAENWLVGRITLDRRHTTLASLGDVFRKSMAGLQAPGGLPGDGLWHLLQRWAGVSKRIGVNAVYRTGMPSRLFHDLQCWLKTDDLGLHNRLLESITGANILSSHHRLTYRQAGYIVNEAVTFRAADVIPAWQAVANIARISGYRGLVLLFDEVESQVDLTLPSRLKAYGFLRQILQSPPPGVAAFLAFTPAFFNFAGLDFKAKFRGAVDAITAIRAAPRLRLCPLDSDLLLELFRKTGRAHACAFRNHYSASEIDERVAMVLNHARSLPLRRLLRLMVDVLDLQASNAERTIKLR